MEVQRLISHRFVSFAAGLLIGLALMIYDEILTAVRYGYCYPYPVVGCIGDGYVASAVPFLMILIAGLLLLLEKHK